MQVPLTAEDRAILALEGPHLVGHTCKVVHLPAGAPTLGELREAVARRLPDAPRPTWRLAGTADAPVWSPDEAMDVLWDPAPTPVADEHGSVAVPRGRRGDHGAAPSRRRPDRRAPPERAALAVRRAGGT